MNDALAALEKIAQENNVYSENYKEVTDIFYLKHKIN